MTSSTVTVIAGTIIALAAIAAATVTAVQGTLDGASFAAIIGAAIGSTGSSAGAILISNGRNGRNGRKEPSRREPSR